MEFPDVIRPPSVLEKTVAYLCDEVLDTDADWLSKCNFLRDRLRSIRQDYTLQNTFDERTVQIFQLMARFRFVVTTSIYLSIPISQYLR